MLIAPLTDEPETTGLTDMMKQLFDGLKRYNYPHADIISVHGMTNDFEIAIEEGQYGSYRNRTI